MGQEPKSLYRRGADTGLYFGLYLSGLFFASSYSVDIPGLSLTTFIMMVAVPFIIYKCMRAYFNDEKGIVTFPSLWMYGIAIFIFGSIIAAAVSATYMKWIAPDFIDTRIQASIELLNATPGPDTKEMVKMLTLVRDSGMIPGPVELSLRMVSFNVFSGSMLSLLMSLLVKARPYKPQK